MTPSTDSANIQIELKILNKGCYMKMGVPADTNPFCSVWDECIDDNTLANVLPQYFRTAAGGDIVVEKENIRIYRLSQREAENLIRQLIAIIPDAKYFVVKVEFTHIIPNELRHLVRITGKTNYSVRLSDCYLAPWDFDKI